MLQAMLYVWYQHWSATSLKYKNKEKYNINNIENKNV